MSNHVHLIIQPLGDENLSSIMQWILSVFARLYNITFNYKGHVWYDRFKSFVIYNYRIFLAIFLYIAYNPVRAGIAKDPFAYKYNGVSFCRNGSFQCMDPPAYYIIVIFPSLMQKLLPVVNNN